MSITEKKVVFIVDDRKDVHDGLRKDFMDRVFLVSATNLKDAEDLFVQNEHGIDLVVMDGCVDGKTIDTLPLVKKIRKTFKGPMIASSMSSSYNEQLVKAGCDHEVGRLSLPEQIFKILGI